MEDGIGSIKILVIVLVVVVQGVSAFRGWAKKQKQRQIQKDLDAGIRHGSTGIYESDASENQAETPPSDVPAWDPFGDEVPRAPELPPIHEKTPPAPVPEKAHHSKAAPIQSEPVPAEMLERAPLVASIAAVAIQNHRLSDPTRRIRANRTSARLIGDASLRTAMLVKIVLDRPLSARQVGNRGPRT